MLFRTYRHTLQLYHVDVAQEQIRRALNNLSLPPRCPPITSPDSDILQSHIAPAVWNTKGDIVAESSDIDPGIPASFQLSTAETDEKIVLSKLSLPRTKLKPHAPEFVPRRQLCDNKISIAATLSDVTNLGPQYSDACQSICTKTPPALQRQNVFEGRDLPPHLSFRDANYLYRPIPIQAPPAVNQQQGEDPVPPKIPNFVSPLPSETVTPSMEMNGCGCNIPSAATYAEATNVSPQRCFLKHSANSKRLFPAGHSISGNCVRNTCPASFFSHSWVTASKQV
ncbi:hypothetical protein PILCRDRAFT_168272 [Piloderma croceum F 1598]|uniref:Uncharacterized protein n=1 Tax=Piloderma croceum (strain F 1598) TaxID=765440 RepID=A0A0C3G4N0_PILCF|nr:hypothetical protein PILCRDRAFT_168272 [Piloderma croceum F 1598]